MEVVHLPEDLSLPWCDSIGTRPIERYREYLQCEFGGNKNVRLLSSKKWIFWLNAFSLHVLISWYFISGACAAYSTER